MAELTAISPLDGRYAAKGDPLRPLFSEQDLIEKATAHYIALDEKKAVVYPINGTRPRNNDSTRQYSDKWKVY